MNKEGVDADQLLINGNPLEDISILVDQDTALALIVKRGEIFKNTVEN